jgi:nucleoside-diphosphate-sugar epimerase
LVASVLVTGITGFTGKYLRHALEMRGDRVVGIADRGVNHPNDRVVDLLDVEAVERAVREMRPEYVVHLAGISFAAHDRPDDFNRVHEDGSRHLLEAITRAAVPVRKVILASSAYVYGRPTITPVAEDAAPAPVNPYGESKLKMEHLARRFFERIPILIVRPFNYTGIGQSEQFVLPKLIEHFRRRAAEIELAETSVIREFSDVRDVAAVYVRLIDSDARSDIVNVCSGIGYRLDAVLDTLKNLTGLAPHILRSAALERKNDIPELVGSPKKLKQLLGKLSFRPLDETLQWMLRG